MVLPRVYPIIDLACFASEADPVLAASRYSEALLSGGATLLQLRDKSADVRRFLSCAHELRRVTRGRARLIINDRADICIAADADGVHLGQDDLSPEAVRRIFDCVVARPVAASLEKREPLRDTMVQPSDKVDDVDLIHEMGKKRAGVQSCLIGYSTHNLRQVNAADSMPIDYIAVGPVFATGSKANPDPVVGIEGVRQARAATRKPLVAIGGITRKNCREVIEAGADSVAVISDLLDSPAKALEQFMGVLG